MADYSVSIHLSNKAQSETELLFSVSGRYIKRFRLSSGIAVKPSDFNVAKNEVRRTDQHSDTKNATLARYKSEIDGACLELIYSQKTITKEAVKAKLSFTGAKERESDFFSAFTEYINFRRGAVVPNTLRKYETLKRELISFSEKTGQKVSFDTMNESLEKNFKEYLYTTPYSGNHTRQDGGVQGFIKKLKAFLTWATEKGYNTNLKYKKFTAPKNEPELNPLTLDELLAFEKLELTDTQDLVRDIFLFQCYTGLRISDVMDLRPSNIRGKVIKDTTLKTKETVFIPLIDRSEAIIEKYSAQSRKTGRVFPRLSTDKIRKHLKQLGEQAGMIYSISVIINKGINREEKVIKRFEALGTNDGRRTFITQCLSKGMNAQMLMRITGHKSVENLQRYVKFSETDLIDIINFTWSKIK